MTRYRRQELWMETWWGILAFIITAVLVGVMLATGNADDTQQRVPIITPSTVPYECGVYVTDGPVYCWPGRQP